MPHFSRTLALLLLLIQADAQAWWNPDWAYRKVITIDTTATGANIPNDLSDVPVLVRLHTGNFAHFLDLTEGGGDLRFVAGDDQTPLHHHLEKLDVVNELAFIWVKVPQIKGATAPGPSGAKDDPATVTGANKIYAYFGNPKALGEGASAATYGPNVALVYHFDELNGVPTDRSGSALPPPTFSGRPNPASLIGAGIKLDGKAALTVADAPVLAINPVSGWGFSIWMKMDAPQTDGYLLERVSGTAQLTLNVAGSNLTLAYRDGSDTLSTNPVPVTPTAWHHVAVTTQNGQFTLWLDGASVGQFAAPPAAMAGALQIGAAADGTHGLVAELDELRVYATLPTADAVKFAAATEGVEVHGLTYLADENLETEGASEVEESKSSFIGIILNQVFGNKEAFIEQFVIGVCGVMALVAFAVMILKQVYLMKCRAATQKFLLAYDKIGEQGNDDIGALYDRDALFGRSPLFKLYRQGINGVRRRAKPDGSIHINNRALLSLRATLDAVMIREGQKLNAQMVLLTIAISGGPFIGLLGTVVGVMVTFAAIAASGDVNINAIAPGMAAALLATTAGLAVAIPSLFGYNYLGSKVKEFSADMHVFADEFLARLNELYGGRSDG